MPAGSFAPIEITALLLALLFFAPPVRGQGELSVPAGPAAERLTELVRLVDDRDYGAAAEYVREAYTDEFRGIAPMHTHLSVLFRGHERGFRIHEFVRADSLEAAALVEIPLTEEWLILSVRVRSAPPHRIGGIGLAPADPPAEVAEAAGPSRDDPLERGRLARRLDRFLERLVAADAFSGAVLVARDGTPIYERAYGVANRDFGVPNGLETRFNLGSMNKMVTAVAVLQLVARGRIELEDRLSEFLPAFPAPEAARRIRIEHLLTHTSGLGSYFTEEFERASRARFRTVDDFLELARGDSLRFEPGTDWRYSNTGMLVLGKVIEEVTGRSYFEYVRDEIYAPAGMARTGSYQLDRVNDGLAVGYEKRFTPAGPTYRNNLFDHVIRGGPAGGGYSTVGDLFRFAEALRDGVLVPERFVRMLWSPKPELGSPDYGFGFDVDTTAKIAGHGGGFAGISANLDVFYAQDFTAIVLANYGGSAPPVVRRIRELVAIGRGK